MAIARAALPHWTVEAVRGVARSAVPLELAAESLEQGGVVTSAGWLASPLAGAAREPGINSEPELVLMVRGKCPESQLSAVANRLSDALAVVEQKDQFYTWVKQPAGAEKRTVSLGTSDDRVIEIKSGLKAGDEVILNPRATVAEAMHFDDASTILEDDSRFHAKSAKADLTQSQAEQPAVAHSGT